MSLFNKSKPLLWLYGGFMVWGLLVLILVKGFVISPLTIFLTFFWLIMAPGFSLARLLKMRDNDSFDQKLLWFVLGFVFTFILCLIAILVHANIAILTGAYLITIVLLFISAFICDFFIFKFEEDDLISKSINKFKFKQLFQSKNLFVLLLILLAVLTMIVVNSLGGSFAGDPTYHLAIMRKVMDGHSFAVTNLHFVFNKPDPTYIFLVWPVFLGMLAKLLHLQNYNLWSQLPTVLTMLFYISWYGVFRKIFPTRYMAILAVIFCAIFMFDGTGYIFTRLPVPDTFAKLILMPLAFWLTFKYVFNKSKDIKLLVLTTLFLLLIACIHLTQYFYFYVIMVAIMIGYTAFHLKDSDYKVVIKRMLTVTFANLILTVPLFGVFQLTDGIITNNFNSLARRTVDWQPLIAIFTRVDVFAKYAYLLLPFSLLFVRRYRITTVILVSMLIAPIVFHVEFLREFLKSIFSYVFMNRFFSNVTWYFSVWALVVGFVISLLDRGIIAFKGIKQQIMSVLLICLSLLIIVFRAPIFSFLFSSHTAKWLIVNFWWMIILISLVCVGLFVAQIYSEKINNFFKVEEPKSTFTIFIITIALIVLITVSSQKVFIDNLKNEWQHKQFTSQAKDYTDDVIDPAKFGGWPALDFIKNNVPAKSIIESNSAYRDLPIMLDIYMTDWPAEDLPEKEYSKLYEAKVDQNTKLKCLSMGNIDYMLVTKKKLKDFDTLPNYMTNIYKNDLGDIYKVDKEKVRAEVGLISPLSGFDCRADQYQP